MIVYLIVGFYSDIFFLKGDCISFPLWREKCFFLKKEETYQLHLPKEYRLVVQGNSKHNEVCIIRNQKNNEKAYLYYFDDSSYNHFQKYECNKRFLTIGCSEKDDIQVQNVHLKEKQFVIDLHWRFIQDTTDHLYGSIQNRLVKRCSFQTGTVFRLFQLQILFHESFLMINHPKGVHIHLPRDQKKTTVKQIEMNPILSNNSYLPPIPIFEPLELQAPETYLERESRPLIFTIGPTLMMAFTSLTSGILISYNGYLNGREIIEMVPMLLLPMMMFLSSLLWMPLQKRYEIKKERKKKEEIQKKYQLYLKSISIKVQDYVQQYQSSLEKRFLDPSAFRIKWFQPPYFESFSTHDNHSLCVRIGLGKGIIPIPITKNFNSEDSFINKQLYQFYKQIEKPVKHIQTINLKLYRTIYISLDCLFILRWILMQVSAYSLSDQVKIAYIGREEDFLSFSWLKHIKHFYLQRKRLFFPNVSSFQHFYESQQNNLYYICVCTLKDPKEISFDNVTIICPIQQEPILREGELLISQNNGKSYCATSTNKQVVTFDTIQKNDCDTFTYRYSFFRPLKPLDSSMSSVVSFYNLFDPVTITKERILSFWHKNACYEGIKAPIGQNRNHSLITLDLHEKGQGPHGLIAGMTGSGKTEFLHTLLLSLMVSYHPKNLQFVLVDFKGGGIAQLFQNTLQEVPHFSSCISNMDSALMNRFMVSFKNECKRREQLFLELSSYRKVPILTIQAYQKEYCEQSQLPYIPELVVIVDEFAELKKEYPEVMKELISLARIGRSLGIHLILSTQKPAGIIDEQIWSNTRFKVCFKVQERQDSKEVLHSEDAVHLKNPGEFILLWDHQLTKGKVGYIHAKKKEEIHLTQYGNNGEENKKVSFAWKENQSQFLETLNMIQEATKEMEYEKSPLWLEPLNTTLFYPDNEKKVLGRYDDYYNKRQPLYNYSLEEPLRMGILSSNQKETNQLMDTILYSFIKEKEEIEHIYVLDGQHTPNHWDSFSDVLTTISFHKPRQWERLFYYLTTHQFQRSVVLLIKDSNSFFHLFEEGVSSIFQLMNQAKSMIHFIFFLSQPQVFPYRLLSILNHRIALMSSSQDLSIFFESTIKKSIQEKEKGLVLKDILYDFRYFVVSKAQIQNLSQNYLQNPSKYPIAKYPEIPEKISFHVKEDGYLLGMNVLDAREIWIQNETCYVIAQYVEDLNAYYEIFRKYYPCILIQEENWKNQFVPFVFVSLEQYSRFVKDTVEAKHLLYIGDGFYDQYIIPHGKRQELFSNEAIYIYRNRNQVIQIVQE